MEGQGFTGFVPDTYRFFMELAFHNEKGFFEANRDRCREVVQLPMRAFAEELLPAALKIDPEFNARLTSIVSRMHRDTRFSKNKLPYRDHAWLSFRRPGKRMSESLVLYFEIDADGYGYGIGMYDANPELMKPLRARAMADPERFLAIVGDERLRRFTLTGEPFKRSRFPGAPEALQPYINRKGMGFTFYSRELSRTFEPQLVAEVRDAFADLKDIYRFIAGMEL